MMKSSKLVIAAPPPPSSLTNIVRGGASLRKVGSVCCPIGRTVLASALAALSLAGCGAHTQRTTSTTAIVAAPSSRSPSTVAACLNSRSFLVEASPHRVSGSSPAGVNFAVTFFANAQAALVAKASHHYRAQISLARVHVGIDDHGNPPSKPGGQARTLAAVDLHTIVVCVLHG